MIQTYLSLLRRHLFELVTRLASYADVLRARHAFSSPRGGETRDEPGVLIFSFCFVPLVLKPRFNLRNMGNKK